MSNWGQKLDAAFRKHELERGPGMDFMAHFGMFRLKGVVVRIFADSMLLRDVAVTYLPNGATDSYNRALFIPETNSVLQWPETEDGP